MKKFKTLLFISLFLNATASFSQPLDSVFISVPCYGAPGLTLPASSNVVDSATMYCWTILSGQINGVLFNGQISPVCAPVPFVNITFGLPQSFYIICVTAQSPCCSSNTSCDTVWGYHKMGFDVMNSPVASPNTTGQYGIYFKCMVPGNINIDWWVTGDITINSVGTSITTFANSIDTPYIDLNFGPAFTTGTLCVRNISAFGIPSDTICMDINAPLGLPSQHPPSSNIYYSQSTQQIYMDMVGYTRGPYSISLIDALGKVIIISPLTIAGHEERIILKTPNLQQGIYFYKVEGNSVHLSGKLLITN